jgi:hypothetical protein
VQHLLKTALPALMIAAVVGSSTACSGASTPAPTPPIPAAPTDAASTRPIPAASTRVTQTSTRPAAAPSVSSSRATQAPQTATPFAQACTSNVLLPLLKRRFDDPSKELVIERVDIRRCRNGYAHVFAITRRNPPGDPQYENEQLFLRFVNGEWQSVSEGTGISCSDEDLRPELAEACRRLGY